MSGLRDHLLAQGWPDAADILAEIERHQQQVMLSSWPLPWPPAANNLYPTVMIGGKPRRITGKRAKAYTEIVAKLMLGKRGIPHGMAISIHIRCWPPSRRRHDLDGVPKGILDALVKAGMMRDDSDIWHLTMSRECVSSPPGRVVVEVRQHILAGEQPRLDAGEAYALAMQSAHDEKQALKDLRRPLLEAPE